MVALNAPVTRQIAIAFNFARVAWIAGFGLTSLALRADDRVDLSLRQIGDCSVGRSSHVGGNGGRE